MESRRGAQGASERILCRKCCIYLMFGFVSILLNADVLRSQEPKTRAPAERSAGLAYLTYLANSSNTINKNENNNNSSSSNNSNNNDEDDKTNHTTLPMAEFGRRPAWVHRSSVPERRVRGWGYTWGLVWIIG